MVQGEDCDLSDPNVKFCEDYNLCFIIVAMAIFGPYIIQYSSLMYIFFSKGFFK